MDFSLMHPSDQLVLIMERIYGYGMTTTSGGNLSIKDENGDIWITPGQIDKGSLRGEDMVCVKPNGDCEGIHKPSIELPFHRAIYNVRPDVKAIVHAHPPALVAFSVARTVPDTNILPTARLICGEVGFAPYALPGSDELGEHIAATFGEGHNTILLENHATAAVGASIFEAFMRFETLDFCARLIIGANDLGGTVALGEKELALHKGRSHLVEEFSPAYHLSRELALRKELCKLIHRAYEQRLFTSTEGTFSVRVNEESFLITPYGIDRKYIKESDLVLIKAGKREKDKIPSRSLQLHQKIYTRNSSINAVVIAHPPHVMAFAVSHKKFDTLTIPECYLMLRDIPLLQYGFQFTNPDDLVEMLGERTPVVLVKNDCFISIGDSLLQAFDRLEIAEFSAQSLIYTNHIGKPVYISKEQKDELKTSFGIP